VRFLFFEDNNIGLEEVEVLAKLAENTDSLLRHVFLTEIFFSRSHGPLNPLRKMSDSRIGVYYFRKAQQKKSNPKRQSCTSSQIHEALLAKKDSKKKNCALKWLCCKGIKDL